MRNEQEIQATRTQPNWLNDIFSTTIEKPISFAVRKKKLILYFSGI